MAVNRDRWTRVLMIVLAVFFIGFGVITLIRSAFQEVKKTDLTVYLRAAWAVRNGEDLYSVTDEHGWHYHYPPLLASLLVPFAQPPASIDEKPLVPFATVVVLWYILGLACVLGAVKLLAGTIGPSGVHRDGKYRRWLIYFPLLIMMPALASSLGRGQINELVLLLLVGMMIAAAAGSRFAAGVWLAGAACFKVIPLFLVVYPLWKRDTKWLAGLALGLALGLIVIPSAIIGPSRTVTLYRNWGRHFIQPALVASDDSPRNREILGATATDNQSLQGIIHNTWNLDRTTRPTTIAVLTKIVHWFIGGLMTIYTLVIAARSELKNPIKEVLSLGALIVPMLLISPVTHLHYFVWLLPVVMAVIASHLAYGQRVRPALLGVLWLVFVTGLLPRIPGLHYARDIGLASIGAIGLWAACLIELSGEAKLKIRLPGIEKARKMFRRRKWVTVHHANSRPRQMEPRRKAS
jgi:hypothetical protein